MKTSRIRPNKLQILSDAEYEDEQLGEPSDNRNVDALEETTAKLDEILDDNWTDESDEDPVSYD